MAAKRRHWKEKKGRYWARISIPLELKPFFGNQTQLTEPLGGDLRIADEKHAAAVARLKDKLKAARRMLEATTSDAPVEPAPVAAVTPRRALTPEDVEQAVWAHYTNTLAQDAAKRAAMPTEQEIADELEKANKRIEAGDADPRKSISGFFNVYSDYELKASMRHFDERLRKSKLKALRAEIATGNTRLVNATVQEFINRHHIAVARDSQEWRDLAQKLMRAEIEALERTCELDAGNFGGTPQDPIVRPPSKPIDEGEPVSLWGLFCDYIKVSQATGTHLDGGANWTPPIRSLQDFLGHDDARKIKRIDLLNWRDALLAEGKSAKTVSAKYLAAVRAVLTWAEANFKLPTNEIEKVNQKVAKKQLTRERGYTKREAVRILKASLNYEPRATTHPSHRESAHITAAKRWVPLLCAFTGARVTEITQLRKQDVFKEAGRWMLRITPEAGSVKTGEYRDAPLHRQVIELGFLEFVKGANEGPLFHRAKTPDKYLSGARTTSGRLSEWLHELNLVPENMQPNYAWRHRFKTQGRELGMSDRVLDAIQGHPGKKAADDYGDVTIAAKARLIDALPHYVFDGSDDDDDEAEDVEEAAAIET
ncbi:site-specific integrase [Rhodobacter capsulatus]|uniref:integrase n=1 Tax=Rhodobacter capsulatus TaxID=1061 RepID=UPI0003D39ECF|nr:integrase [Rhodobacter capsulatus]ETD81023.1 integrase [Rhodobacter capsulatus B6]